MALTARIGRLEETVAARPPAPCPVCGAPAGWVPSLRLVNDQGVDLGPTCTRCSFPLMTNGRAISAAPPGSVQRRIVLDRMPAGFEPQRSMS